MKKSRYIPFAIVTLLFVLVLLVVPVTTDLENSSNNLSILDYLQGKKASEQSTTATMIIGGDVMLGRTVMTTSLNAKDPAYPFRLIADFTSSADIALVNLENPILADCKRDITGVSLIFCAQPSMADGLVMAGIDVVSLANNHTLNYGRDGFEQTKGILLGNGISYTGDNNLVVKDVGTTKFGFVGFDKSQQTNPDLSEEETNLIIDSDNQVDVLVVSMHWGVEYQDIALPGVQELARKLVDLGADVVVGHHPHWVQNYERINGKPVYYSLGNLVFDQMWSDKTKTGMLVKLTFENGELVNEELVETYMEEWAQPAIIN